MKTFAKLFAVMAVLFLAFALPVSAPASPQHRLSGRIQMKDGDSAYVAGQEVRLHGIDAPEWAQVCTLDGIDWRAGQEATAWAQSFVGDGWASCTIESTDRYRRLIATCMVDGQNLNEALVSSGWALAYRFYSKRYVGAEKKAKSARLGVWAGVCQNPWEWRRDQRQQQRKNRRKK